MTMTDDQLGLSRRLVACEQWRCVRGMIVTPGCIVVMTKNGQVAVRSQADGKTYWYSRAECVPDLSDYATAAILLRMAMESNEDVTPEQHADNLHKWGVDWGHGPGFEPGEGDLGTTAARVLLAIWEKAA